MRFLLVSLSILARLLFDACALSTEQSADRLTAEQHDIGRIETRLQKYDQAIGVVTRLVRPLGANAECQGVCFLPSSSRPVSWRCAPNASCDLYCDVNPPVG
jgi:hypothetical protein